MTNFSSSSISNHFCPDCLSVVVGPRGSEVLLQMAVETNLSPEHYFLILQAAELAYEHAASEGAQV